MSDLATKLRHMIAVLQAERQALAGMDIDALFATTSGKQALCDRIEGAPTPAIDAEAQGLLVTARQLNEVNRRVRNLMAANVSTRLEALSGAAGLYNARNRARIGLRQTA